jgi:phage shock protein E
MENKFFYIIVVIVLIYFFYNNYSKSKKAIKMIENGAKVIDVRTSKEFDLGHFAGSVNIPLNIIENNIEKIKSFKKDIIVVCASGVRSGKANSFLKKNGIKSANGGAWSSLK